MSLALKHVATGHTGSLGVNSKLVLGRNSGFDLERLSFVSTVASSEVGEQSARLVRLFPLDSLAAKRCSRQQVELQSHDDGRVTVRALGLNPLNVRMSDRTQLDLTRSQSPELVRAGARLKLIKGLGDRECEFELLEVLPETMFTGDASSSNAAAAPATGATASASAGAPPPLSVEQKARIEQNKQRAMAIRQQKSAAQHPREHMVVESKQNQEEEQEAQEGQKGNQHQLARRPSATSSLPTSPHAPLALASAASPLLSSKPLHALPGSAASAVSVDESPIVRGCWQKKQQRRQQMEQGGSSSPQQRRVTHISSDSSDSDGVCAADGSQKRPVFVSSDSSDGENAAGTRGGRTVANTAVAADRPGPRGSSNATEGGGGASSWSIKRRAAQTVDSSSESSDDSDGGGRWGKRKRRLKKGHGKLQRGKRLRQRRQQLAEQHSKRESTAGSSQEHSEQDESEIDVASEESDEDVLEAALGAVRDVGLKLKQQWQRWGVDRTGQPLPQGSRSCSTSASALSSGSCTEADEVPMLAQEGMTMLQEDLRLSKYQLLAVNWLHLLHCYGQNQILADEMGLGKTVQTIAFLALLRQKADEAMSMQKFSQSRSQGHKKSGPHLIIVPASVLSNWQREFERFAPQLRVAAYHGTQKEREVMQYQLSRPEYSTNGTGVPCWNGTSGSADSEEDDDSFGSAPRAQQQRDHCSFSFDVLLSTYSYFERESGSDDRAFLRRFPWEYMVLDEGHSVKNAKSNRVKRLSQIPVEHRLLLTGTPVQNDLGELLALMAFAHPAIFGQRGRRDLGALIMQQHEAEQSVATAAGGSGGSGDVEHEAVCGYSKSVLNRVRQLMQPFVLRRLKSEVLAQMMPKKTELVLVQLPSEQQRVYDAVLKMLGAGANESGGTRRNGSSKQRKAIRRPAGGDSAAVEHGAVDTHSGTKRAKAQDWECAKCTLKNPARRQRCDACGAERPVVDMEPMPLCTNVANHDLSDTEGDRTTAQLGIHSPIRLSAKQTKNYFTQLRKAANHPLLLRTLYKSEEQLECLAQRLHAVGCFGHQCRVEQVRKELESCSDFDITRYCADYADASEQLAEMELPQSTLVASAKMNKLREMLPRLQREGHRMLLFSQWTTLLDLLERLLEGLGLRFIRLDGSTSVQDRQALIDQFNRDAGISVFLLSTRAGGLGINLTAADTVIIHDLDFNPHIDRQAEDRCHRIGQTKQVTVYKLVCSGTVDEGIYQAQEKKRKLDEALLKARAGEDEDDGGEHREAGRASDASDRQMMQQLLGAELAR